MEQREIKFRCWNGNRMEYGYEPLRLLHNVANGSTLTKLYRYTIMQFTGLLDKNGKEIYDSDILYYEDSIITSTENGSEHEPLWTVGAMEWNDRRMGWYLANRYSVDMEELDFGTCEVVGNIFENPELLTIREGGE